MVISNHEKEVPRGWSCTKQKHLCYAFIFWEWHQNVTTIWQVASLKMYFLTIYFISMYLPQGQIISIRYTCFADKHGNKKLFKKIKFN